MANQSYEWLKKHSSYIGPVVNKNVIDYWENKQSEKNGFKIELPEDFKYFLMNIGNGYRTKEISRYFNIRSLNDIKIFDDDNILENDCYTCKTVNEPIDFAIIGEIQQGEYAYILILTGDHKGEIAMWIDGCEIMYLNRKFYEEIERIVKNKSFWDKVD